MPETLCAHWLIDVARESGLLHADGPAIDSAASIADAWRAVARSAGVSQAHLAGDVARHFRLALADLTAAQPHVVTMVPERLARMHHVFPLRETDHEIVVASPDPMDIEGEQLLAFVTGRHPIFEIAPPDAIQELLDTRYAPDRAVERLLDRIGAGLSAAIRVEPEAAPMRSSSRSTARSGA